MMSPAGRGQAPAGERAGVASPAVRPRGPRHVYVHVPFCRDRCDYCEFYSTPVGARPDPRLLDGYVDAVRAEWTARGGAAGACRLESVYLGGGTPSLLGEERLERLLEPFQPLLTPRAEVTVETNPEDVTPAYARWAAALRVRVSLGVQSFDGRLREALGRRAAADPSAAFRRLREAGVAPLGVDLIFGIPGQTADDVDRELVALATLGPDHVSWYELTLAPGSMLAARVELTEAGRLGWEAPFLPGEDETAALYRRVVRGLARLGYGWYEVSNFARPGLRCRHNAAVWRGDDYLGLGPAAVGTAAGRRRRNRPDLERYLAASCAAGPFDPPHDDETLDETACLRERLFLAARTGAGMPLAELAPALDGAALRPLVEAGFVSLRGGTLRVTRKGRYVADAVCVRLFRASSFSEA